MKPFVPLWPTKPSSLRHGYKPSVTGFTFFKIYLKQLSCSFFFFFFFPCFTYQEHQRVLSFLIILNQIFKIRRPRLYYSQRKFYVLMPSWTSCFLQLPFCTRGPFNALSWRLPLKSPQWPWARSTSTRHDGTSRRLWADWSTSSTSRTIGRWSCRTRASMRPKLWWKAAGEQMKTAVTAWCGGSCHDGPQSSITWWRHP